MPVMDGFQVLEQLKADKAWRDIPVIVISAMNDVASVAKGIKMGAEDYLPKPFDEVLLKARLDVSLEKKRLRDQELAYLGQVDRLTEAAVALETDTFDPGSLSDVAERDDALGQLTRLFQCCKYAIGMPLVALLKAVKQFSLCRTQSDRDLLSHCFWQGFGRDIPPELC